eukprot:2732336-Rhodomonas_salina.1
MARNGGLTLLQPFWGSRPKTANKTVRGSHVDNGNGRTACYNSFAVAGYAATLRLLVTSIPVALPGVFKNFAFGLLATRPSQGWLYRYNNSCA